MNNRLNESSRPNELWIERAVALLDESADALDAATLSSLNRARQAALAQRRPRLSAWMMGSGFVGAALALVLAFGLRQHPASSPMSAPVAIEPVVDADALASDDNLDLYENLDFYAWLDAQQQDGNG
ncbi:MAG: hypothetical protein ABIO49_11215 [Dokdonella sp.]